MSLPAKINWRAATQAFAGLDMAERRDLTRWLRRNGSVGGVEDLSGRPWNVPDANVVLGVFVPGQERAAWLLIRDPAGWTIARCGTGDISSPPLPLRDALTLIAGSDDG